MSSQAFYPLQARPFLVVVAAHGPRPDASGIRAFLSSGSQGVNYRRNTWHHALIALDCKSTFLVVDRGGAGENCEEISVDPVVFVTQCESVKSVYNGAVAALYESLRTCKGIRNATA